jgi:glycosyltransferase involved in cell wall biosynthesis
MSGGTMQETVSIAWCDNGMVDGKFMQGVTDVMLKSGITFSSTLRSQGNQIARQRQTVIDYWYDKSKSDWLLWVDSDIVISPEKFRLLWDNKDAKERPLISGVYFTTDNPEEPLMIPMPTVYSFTNKGDGTFGLSRIHPLPENKIIKADAAGFGFILMHRSIVEKVKAVAPDGQMFMEMGRGTKFIGEDIFFFMLCDKAEVPLYCHTGALAPHMKRFSFDEHYYNAFFGKPKEELKSKLITPDKKIITPR